MRRGLVFFSKTVDPAFRRRRIAFVAVLSVAAFVLIWPGYVPFSTARPFILGLPLSMAWVVLWLLIIFFVALWLYLKDLSAESPRD